MRHLDEALHLIGTYISPLPNASTHVKTDRTRKLLLHAAKIRKLIGRLERAGYTLIQLHLHYSQGHIQLEIELAKGK